MDSNYKTYHYSPPRYGTISNAYAVVSLYEISAHPGLQINKGNMVLVFPENPQLRTSDIEKYSMRCFALEDMYGANNWRTKDRQPIPDWDETHFRLLGHVIPQALRLESEKISVGKPSAKEPLTNCLDQTDLVHCFGEVVDICLDGDVIVRFGASPDAQEVKTRSDRVTVLASGDTLDSDDESDWTEDESASEADEALSETDNEIEADDSTNEREEVESQENEVEMSFPDEKEILMPNGSTHSQRISDPKAIEPALQMPIATGTSRASGSAAPESFKMLDSPTPHDHRFAHRHIPLTANTMRRIAKEHKILGSSLPEGIFVRTWEARLDLLRIIIVGPVDTPYEYAPFMIDMHCDSSFPDQPPDAYFHSWTNNGGRINPNLYEDGKICLSLLGTWHADDSNETWSPSKSTILQIIVSILGLVLVKQPYYSKLSFPPFPSPMLLVCVHDDLSAFGSSTAKEKMPLAFSSPQ